MRSISKATWKNLILLVSLLCLTACSKWMNTSVDQAQADEHPTMTAEQLYSTGKHAVDSQDYDLAAKNLEELQIQYPFGKYAEKGLVKLVYAYYMDGDNVSAAASAARYLKLYPRGKDLPYVLHLKGMANYDLDRGIFAKYLRMDKALRDPHNLIEAYADFETLSRRFPASKYTPDAREKMVEIRNLFARHELKVAQFYFQRKRYVAAINRASYLLKHFPAAPQTEQALVILVKANRALHLDEPANQALAQLQHDYPEAAAKI